MPSNFKIIYHTTLYKVMKAIDNLRSINFDVSSYEEALQNLQTNLALDLSGINKIPLFQHEIYLQYTTKLNNIYTSLMSHEIYLQISNFIFTLKEFITSPQKSIPTLNEFSAQLLHFINHLKSAELDHLNSNDEILSDLYELSFLLIKEEIKLKGESTILTTFKTDDIDIYNLDRVITTYISRLNLKDSANNDILLITTKIKSRGLTATYVDNELITHLAIREATFEELENLLKELTIKNDIYKHRLIDLKVAKIISSDRLYRTQEYITELEKKIKSSAKVFLTSLTISTTLLTGSFLLGHFCSKEKHFLNEKTTYDTISEETTTTSTYEANSDASCHLYKYEPWHQTNDGFTRLVATYDLSNIPSKTFAEYLTMELESLGLYATYNLESVSEITNLYKKTYYKLERLMVNLDDYQIISDKSLFIGLSLAFSLMSILIHMILDILLSSININDNNYVMIGNLPHSLYQLIKNYRKLLSELKNCHKYEENTNLYEYQLQRFYLENKEFFTQLKNIIPILEQIPELKPDELKELRLNLQRTNY